MVDPRYHIRVKPDDVGKYVIVVGDRGRVERVAKYLQEATKVGDNREYLTYTGYLKGEKVSVMSTGMGSPAMAIGIEELATTNARVVIRVGTTGALQKGLNLGDSLIVTASVRMDGTTNQYIIPEYPAVADFSVVNALIGAAKCVENPYHVGIVLSTDSYYGKAFDEEKHGHLEKQLIKAGVLGVEMEIGALYVIGSLKKLKTGAILTVREELTDEGYIQAGEKFEQGLEKSIMIALKAIEILIERGA
ncbi:MULTISPECIES: nucleoside phosphorylase [Pseudothermotoga]|uniref:nucleoside phosphorylase n=1 Tax=Pseudothermotoga TaxID=1643951 RepID=UPI000746FDD3|nr:MULTISPECIES: nucleoside phosphorylase [Pseudothermotoga]KUK21077.1 MAG: Purine or other phosphorylase family 1 [Pseudothermotoga lettingae]MDK2883768.1 uridine phosphorylase [Pseudothermotoga sp.]HBJ81023.1 purine phosphorylase [Pseudothermotoga sp.]HBT26406.1 purine phosphorylase [Pseudothermotoga sp.]